MGKIRKEQREVVMQQFELATLFTQQWFELATSIFRWQSKEFGEWESQEIERLLYMFGYCTVFRDPRDNVIKVMPLAQRYQLNEYGQPTTWTAISRTGVNWNLTNENAVLLWNNKSRLPTYPYIDFIIKKLVNVEATIDTHLNAIKTPFIFSGEEKALLEMKIIFKRITSNEPVIYRIKDKTLDNSKTFEVFNTNVTFIGDSLMMMYDNYEGRILKHLGLKFNNIQKKERVITSEIETQSDYVMFRSNSYYHARLRACEEMKKILKIDVSVILDRRVSFESETKEE
jgi:hypothetical protein